MAGGGRIQQHSSSTELHIKQSFLFNSIKTEPRCALIPNPTKGRRGAAFRLSSHFFYALSADSVLVPGYPSTSVLLCDVPNSRAKYSTHVDVALNVSGLPSAYQPLCACVCGIEIMFAEMGRVLQDCPLEINTFHDCALSCGQLLTFACNNSA